ncbi:MAG: hypothetical protein K0R50_2426 [Eubacterium sp.]|jgi:hypothetical protein|nr:hypothetical protein [Eubacterium sp.]
MSTKTLPITIPPIIGYTVHAYPLTVAFSSQKCLPWFYSNYIQMISNTEYDGVFLDFLTLCNILNGGKWVDFLFPGIPWLKCCPVGDFIITKCNLDIHSLITNALNENNYVVIFLDEFYIPNRRTYQKSNFYHENFIFGYDTAEKTYDILGFDERRLFNSGKVSYHELEQGFKSNHLTDPEAASIKLLKLDTTFSYELDLQFIRDSLLDYVNSQNTCNLQNIVRNPMKKCVYGLNTYHELIRYFELLYDNSIRYDIRPIHILWEHKKTMLLRIEYLSKMYPEAGFNEVYEQYIVIEQKCLSLRQALIKYSISKQPSHIKNIIATLKFVSEMEREILNQLIYKIQPLIV